MRTAFYYNISVLMRRIRNLLTSFTQWSVGVSFVCVFSFSSGVVAVRGRSWSVVVGRGRSMGGSVGASQVYSNTARARVRELVWYWDDGNRVVLLRVGLRA